MLRTLGAACKEKMAACVSILIRVIMTGTESQMKVGQVCVCVYGQVVAQGSQSSLDDVALWSYRYDPRRAFM